MMIDITLLPLREGFDEIEQLVTLFLNKQEAKFKAFDKLCEKLKNYCWQGDFRQLFKALESWIFHFEFADTPLDLEQFLESHCMLPPICKRST